MYRYDNNQEFIAILNIPLLSLFLTLSRYISRLYRGGISNTIYIVLRAVRLHRRDGRQPRKKFRKGIADVRTRWHFRRLAENRMIPVARFSFLLYVQRSRGSPIFLQTDNFTTGASPMARRRCDILSSYAYTVNSCNSMLRSRHVVFIGPSISRVELNIFITAIISRITLTSRLFPRSIANRTSNFRNGLRTWILSMFS